MSLHLEAKKEDIAETVLLSGDPLRAKYVAENMLDDAKCYNKVRNMLGYTGFYKGKRVSVQGTGMGQPSLAIYAHELINEYHAKKLIRIGTCGALSSEIKLGDIIIAHGASTDSSMNKMTFQGLDFSAIADFELLRKAVEFAEKRKVAIKVGNVFSTDVFYMAEDPKRWQVWSDHQVLCAEMESSLLYTMAARHNVQALSILTVSDNIITGEAASSEEREKKFHQMTEIALQLI